MCSPQKTNEIAVVSREIMLNDGEDDPYPLQPAACLVAEEGLISIYFTSTLKIAGNCP